MDLAIIIGIVFFIVYFAIDYFSNSFLGNDFLSKFFVLLYFFFVFSNVDPDIAIFYLIMGMIAFVFSLFRLRQSFIEINNAQSIQIKNSQTGQTTTVKGFGFYLMNLVIGFLSFGLMLLISRSGDSSKVQIFIGVPSLSIVALNGTLSYATVQALSIIENQFIIVFRAVLELVRKPLAKFIIALITGLTIIIPFLAIILIPIAEIISVLLTIIGPIMLAALLFSIFHLAAYNLLFSALFFAWLIMVIWLIAYQVTKNDIIMNVGHMLWNSFVTFLRKGGGLP